MQIYIQKVKKKLDLYRFFLLYSSMNKNTIIFDLDGTLANIDARRELSLKPNGKMDWDVFFDAANISLDLPNEPVIKMAQLFAENSYL